MTKTTSENLQKTTTPLSFTGCGIWAAYFLFKFGLFWESYIDLNLFLNLLLFLAFCISFSNSRGNFVYKFLLSILALMLLYHDSYLPKPSQIIYQASYLAGFSFSYMLDLAAEFVNWTMVVALFGIIFAIYILGNWVRLTTLVSLCFIIAGTSKLSLSPEGEISYTADLQACASTPASAGTASSADIPAMTAAFSHENLEKYLENFYSHEKQRIVPMPEKLPSTHAPFDIVILNICSMATDDIEAENLTGHSLFDQFNVGFRNFNSAASYSAPASLHLLRANCGLELEDSIFNNRRPECEIITSLEKIGYNVAFFMDHDGQYSNYLTHIRNMGGIKAPLTALKDLTQQYESFDGTPIYSDRELFANYLQTVAEKNNGNTVSFFNLISLHDGNRVPGKSGTLAYGIRLKHLLNDIEYFTSQLEEKGRKTLFIMVPEHGAAIRGDKMQISKLREIPTDRITRIPVMIKFVGFKNLPKEKIYIDTPHSYMAISEIVRRAIEQNIFSAENNGTLQDVVKDLPQTAPVSESTNAFFMLYNNRGYYKLKGDEWAPYNR